MEREEKKAMNPPLLPPTSTTSSSFCSSQQQQQNQTCAVESRWLFLLIKCCYVYNVCSPKNPIHQELHNHPCVVLTCSCPCCYCCHHHHSFLFLLLLLWLSFWQKSNDLEAFELASSTTSLPIKYLPERVVFVAATYSICLFFINDTWTQQKHTHTNHRMINKPTQYFFNKKIWYQSHKHNHQHSLHTHYYNTTFQK